MAEAFAAAYFWRMAGKPGETSCASSAASQFVSRMQPWDSVLPMDEGSGVPWIP